MAHDKAYTFVAALLRRSKNRTATNLDHYAKRSVYLLIARCLVGWAVGQCDALILCSCGERARCREMQSHGSTPARA